MRRYEMLSPSFEARLQGSGYGGSLELVRREYRPYELELVEVT
jgi:hypothetical protein